MVCKPHSHNAIFHWKFQKYSVCLKIPKLCIVGYSLTCPILLMVIVMLCNRRMILCGWPNKTLSEYFFHPVSHASSQVWWDTELNMWPCHITCNVSTEITNITCSEISEEKYMHLSFSQALWIYYNYLRYTETQIQGCFLSEHFC